MCIYGVPYIKLMFEELQSSLNSFPLKAFPLSVLMVCGRPLGVTHCSKPFFAILPVGASQMHAAGHLLYRSMESDM